MRKIISGLLITAIVGSSLVNAMAEDAVPEVIDLYAERDFVQITVDNAESIDLSFPMDDINFEELGEPVVDENNSARKTYTAKIVPIIRKNLLISYNTTLILC